MIEFALIFGTALLVWVVLTAPVRTVFVVLVIGLSLIPPLAHVPTGVTSQVFIVRVLLVAAALGLLIRIRRGEADGARFGGHPVFVLALLAVAVTLVNGVALVHDPANLGTSVQRYLLFADQVLVLFVLCAVLRAVDDLVWAAKVIVLAFTGAALVGIIENTTGYRPVAAIFGSVSPLLNATLTTRGGFKRPRGTFEFAQEFGLVLAFVVPLAVAWITLRRRSVFPVIACALIVIVSLLTISRSAVIAMGVGALVLVIFSRSRSIRAAALVGLGGVLIATVVFSSWWAAFSGSDTTASVEARFDRPPVVAGLVANHPWTGVGLSGIEDQVLVTDNQYVLTYAEIGVVGTVALGALWIGIVVALGWGLFSPPSPERMVLVGCLAGVVGGLVGAATIDLFTLGGSRVFWLLAALGLVAAERIAPPLRLTTRRSLVVPGLLAAGAGMAIGVIAIAVYPRTAARDFVFVSWPTRAESKGTIAGVDISAVYAETVCEHTAALDRTSANAEFYCRALRDANGVGDVRIAAGDRQQLDQAVHDEQSIGNVLSGFQLLSNGPVIDALPNAVRTAPVWLAALFAFVVWIPRLRPRPRAPVGS